MVPRDPRPGESGPQWNVRLGAPSEPAAAPAVAPPAAPEPEPRTFFAPVRRSTEWPVDRDGRPWLRSRFGQPMCPIDELPPGRKPGEAPGPGQSYDVMRDAIAAWRAAEEVFADPGRFARIGWSVSATSTTSGVPDAPANADPAPEAHLYDRVRNFLARRRKLPTRASRHLRMDAVFGPLGVLRPRLCRKAGAMS
jgi:hypothetical protein